MKKIYNIKNNCVGMYNEEIIDTIIKSRGIKDIDEFLNPTEKHLIPNTKLEYIKEARMIVEKGINEKKRFTIHFDTDLDGVSAGTVMYRYLKHYTDNVNYTINQGKEHGLIGQNLEQFNDTDILIVVDSLDENTSAYGQLYNKGIEIIVLDHHDIDESVDYGEFITLVSSQLNYPNKALSGVGVVWKFCDYLDEYFMESYASEYLDLVACGLIGDMSDVSENSMENRYLISQGLNNLRNPAIKKILGSYPFNSTAISFSIAPLINASNRVSKNEVALKAFLEDDNKELLKYIKELKNCKEIQNESVGEIIEDIIAEADKQIDEKVIYVFIDSEHSISGLIGNKLLEKYQRPLLMLKERDENGIKYYSGSSRAIGVKDFRKMCENTGLCNAKGHPLAFGIDIEKEDFEEFLHRIKDGLKDVEFEIVNDIDIELDLSDINSMLIDKIKELDRIAGEGFKPIKFKVSNIDSYEIGMMSDYKHLTVKPSDYFQFIKWNFNGSFEDMEDKALMGDNLTFVGNLTSGYIGRKFSLQMICDDIIE